LYEYQKRLPAEARRVHVVHLPKTIDNDYRGIDFTFGFFTAVDVMAKELQNLRADAIATSSYFVVETMGRKAGWLSYGVAIAGEANLVLAARLISTLSSDDLLRELGDDAPVRRHALLGPIDAPTAPLRADPLIVRRIRGEALDEPGRHGSLLVPFSARALEELLLVLLELFLRHAAAQQRRQIDRRILS
jgi:hypothetical protein